MHRALLNLAVPDSAVGGLHTVLVDDVPQDTDVFLVIARRPRRHELIATAHYNYAIALDGSITWQVADRESHRQRPNMRLKLPGARVGRITLPRQRAFLSAAPPPCAGGRCARSLSAIR